MKLDTLGLEAFVAVVEHGSFQKAASALFISQAGLSRRLKNLESQLDVVLIERTTRSWRLSSVGIGFLPRAQSLLAEMNNAFHEIRDASKQKEAEVSVACIASFAHHLLPQILLRHGERHPGNRVRIIDGTTAEVNNAVLSKRCDIGITVLGGPHTDIHVEQLIRDPFVVVCRDDHRLRSRKAVRWKDLRNESLILLAQSTGSGLSFKQALNSVKLILPRLYEVQHAATALGMVNAGLGAAILPSLNLFRGVYPRVRALPLSEPAIQRDIGLIHLRDAHPSPAVERFCAIIREVVSQKPDAGNAGQAVTTRRNLKTG